MSIKVRGRIWSALRRQLRRDKRVWLALAVFGAAQLCLRLIMRSRSASDCVVRCFVRPYHKLMGRVCGLLPFSVAELCWAVLVVYVVWHLARTVWLVVRPRRSEGEEGPAAARIGTLVHRALLACAVAVGVYTGYTLLWGPVYYAQTFEEKIGVTAAPVSVEELEAVTRLFVEKVNEAAPLAAHIEPGRLTGDTKAIFTSSDTLYDALCGQYPFLERTVVRPKPLLFSRVLSVINFTGFFFPFTGEANLNVDSPECMLPATIAHELAHVRGVAPEQTANFVAVLACDTCGDPLYTYSGALLGYIHLSNALYSASRERWEAVAKELCETANDDLRANNAYWRQFDSPVAEAADKTYSGFLQSYDQELGSKSYGAVVDLLVAYYGPAAQTRK